MTMTEVSISVPQMMAEYTVSNDEKSNLIRNAMILFPYIQNDTISHGKAAQILGIHKMDLIALYSNLGLPYLDTRSFENTLPLVPNLLDKEKMHTDYIIPLQKGGEDEHYQFMVTSNTPRSVIEKMAQDYANYGEKCDFFLISLSGYNVFMLRYDPPKEIHYDDIKIASEGD
jgi:hypothetical protein